MMSWKGPWSHVATMLLGRTGFTATVGSWASSVGQVPKALNPVLHVPTALGRESSTSELLRATAAAVSGLVDDAVGVSRSLQAASSAAASSRNDSMRSRYIVAPVLSAVDRQCGRSFYE